MNKMKWRMARIGCVFAAFVIMSGCSERWAVSPPTVAQLEQIVRLARERQHRFDQVYANPDKFSRQQRTDAILDLPPLPIPKGCLADGSESQPDCIRYAGQLYAGSFYSGEAAGAYSMPYGFGLFAVK